VSDIVDAVIYLENAPYVTGEILHVDGRQSRRRVTFRDRSRYTSVDRVKSKST
jgi:hypothetical protein